VEVKTDLDSAWILEKVALLPPLVFSLSVHEMAHARTALAFGDPTARDAGRCTINPLAHLDPIGTLALLLAGFGWARPVPVNVHNLHPPKWGNIAVSLAGPVSNLMLAILTAVILRLLLASEHFVMWRMSEWVIALVWFTLAANVCLFIFNMIPLYPLDGHHIFREQLPADMQVPFMQWQLQYGRFILMGLIFLPFALRGTSLSWIDPLGWVLRHAMVTMMHLVYLV
jgi:Zn-dependent protease